MDNLIYTIPALLLLVIVGNRLIKSMRRHYAQDRYPTLLQPAKPQTNQPLRLVIWAQDRPDATKTVLIIPPNRTTVSFELGGMAVWYVPSSSKSIFLCSSSNNARTDIVSLTPDQETPVEINGTIFRCYPTAAASNKEAFAKASA